MVYGNEITIQIATKKLMNQEYSINKFFHANPTLIGKNKLHLSGNLNEIDLVVGLIKVKADWFLPKQTKYIILHERNLSFEEYPNIVDSQTAKSWLVSLRDSKGKILYIKDQDLIGHYQMLLASKFGIY